MRHFWSYVNFCLHLVTLKRICLFNVSILSLVSSGELSADYNGPREYAGIVKYMKSQVGPASKPIASDADLTKYLADKKDVVIVSYGDHSEQEAVFLKVADALRETVAFAHCASCTAKTGIYLHRPKHLQSKFEDSELEFKVRKNQRRLLCNEKCQKILPTATVRIPFFLGYTFFFSYVL